MLLLDSNKYEGVMSASPEAHASHIGTMPNLAHPRSTAVKIACKNVREGETTHVVPFCLIQERYVDSPIQATAHLENEWGTVQNGVAAVRILT